MQHQVDWYNGYLFLEQKSKRLLCLLPHQIISHILSSHCFADDVLSYRRVA